MRGVQVGPEGAWLRFVELAGPEPARVYLHGLGSSSAHYFATAATHPALSRRRSLLLDLFGYGISDRPRQFGYAIEDHAGAVAAALDALNISGADIIGHSMGGSVAIVLAARRPDLVAHLVVAEPNLDPSRRERIESFTEEEFVARGFAETLASIEPIWAATMRLSDPLAVYRTERSLAVGTQPMMRDLLVGLTMPRTLLVGALSDALDGRGELEAAGVAIGTIAGAGHNMMVDNPAEFALTVRRATGQE